MHLPFNPPQIARKCPRCQHDIGSPDAETCPGCGASVIPSCLLCGYDLKGLPRDGMCPECGTPVEQSYLPDLLQHRSQEYLRRLRSGLSFVLNGILAWVIVIVGGVFAGIAGVPGAELALAFAGLCCSIAIMLGWWMLTTPDPGKGDAADDLRSRQIIRLAVSVQAAASLFELTVRGVLFSSAAVVSGPLLLIIQVVGVSVSILSAIAWVAQFFAAMQYVRWLAQRVPDVKLNASAKRFMWLGPVLFVFGLPLLGIGPLIALVMYWNMLDRLRKHIRGFIS